MCLSIALTATRLGATIANHTEVLELIKSKDSQGKEVVSGAKVCDRITGKRQFFNHICEGSYCGTVLYDYDLVYLYVLFFQVKFVLYVIL